MKQAEYGAKIYQLCLSVCIALCLTIGLLLSARAQATIITVGEDSRLGRTLTQPTELLVRLGISAAEIDVELKARPRILLQGAGFVHNVEVKLVLAENSEILQRLGIPLELAQKRLQIPLRILVKGAGTVRGLRSVSFTDFRQTLQRILIRGAGFARSIVLEEMPTPTPSPTPVVTPDVFPTIAHIQPNQGSNHAPNDLYVFGANFANGATVRLGTTTLTQTTFVDAGLLQPVVPKGFVAGLYDLTVTNPDGGAATLADAYTVYDAENNDDLFANAYELWTDPAAPRAGSAAKVGLVVHRQGGKQPLANVTIRYYLGDPNAGGVLIGESAIPLLSPRTSSTTSGVAWAPTAAGAVTLYAVIDPANAVAESYEENNVVHRAMAILPAAEDKIAPHVDSFVINDGAATTTERTVRLTTTASDPEPGRGVAALLFIEFEFSPAANQWVPLRISSWSNYAVTSTNFTWTLQPTSGMKYLQAWAADGAGMCPCCPTEPISTTFRLSTAWGRTSGASTASSLKPARCSRCAWSR